jgi:hypothetical protein
MKVEAEADRRACSEQRVWAELLRAAKMKIALARNRSSRVADSADD